MRVATLQEAVERYGEIIGGRWPDEAKWCVVIPFPKELDVRNGISGGHAGHIYCNMDMAGPLSAALRNVVDRGLGDQLVTFDGCFIIRDVRGEVGKQSCHSYALAVDFNAKMNRLGQEPTITPEFVKCFTDEGFSWGGLFSRKDGMHFSYAWENHA